MQRNLVDASTILLVRAGSHAKMAALAATSPLPHSPDREAIGTLCEALLREGLGLVDATRSTK